jgi:hypothetical protein
MEATSANNAPTARTGGKFMYCANKLQRFERYVIAAVRPHLDPEQGEARLKGGRGRLPRIRGHEVTRYLISFDDGAMNIPAEEMPAVGEAAHKVVREAKNAGVWVFGGGVVGQRASIVATDGTVTDGPYPETKAVIGGFSIVDVPSREQALEWAAKIAVACRCAQEVRELGDDPEV